MIKPRPPTPLIRITLLVVALVAGSRTIVLPSTMALASSSSSTKMNMNDVTLDDNNVVLQESYITLPTTGVTAQIVYGHPKRKKKTIKTGVDDIEKKPPLVFLHGSFHGAWCWQEHWMPYFVSHGYQCVALNWRGTGGTPPPEEGTKKIKISEHCEDLRGLLDVLPSILDVDDDNDDDMNNSKNKKNGKTATETTEAVARPVLVSHSMGGIYVMKYLEEQSSKPNGPKLSEMFSGIATFCSTPPSGNGPSTFRVIHRSLRDAYRITVGFVLKKVNTDASICRQCFFGGEVIRDDGGNIVNDHGVTDDDVERYQTYFTRDSKAVLDVSDLSRCLPSKSTDANGRAPFVTQLPPCLVVGAQDDFIVDTIGNQESATYYGLEETVFIDSPHDVMLGKNWKAGADVLKEWLEKI